MDGHRNMLNLVKWYENMSLTPPPFINTFIKCTVLSPRAKNGASLFLMALSM